MRPRIAEPTLAAAFVDPAVSWLERQGTTPDARAGGCGPCALPRIASSHSISGAAKRRVAADESIILAVPPWVAAALVPDLTVPDDFRAIVNAHFAYTPARRASRR